MCAISSETYAASELFSVYNAMSLGLAIRELRRERGLTQSELAGMLNIPRRYISTLEQGHATEQLERLIAVLRELDARLMVLMKAEW